MTDKTTAHTLGGLENNALSPGLEQTSGDRTSPHSEGAVARGGWGYEPILAFWKAFEAATAKHGHYESTRAALNAAIAASWQPMDTAPTEFLGERVLLRCSDAGFVTVGRWDGDSASDDEDACAWLTDDGDYVDRYGEPNGWMSLPSSEDEAPPNLPPRLSPETPA